MRFPREIRSAKRFPLRISAVLPCGYIQAEHSKEMLIKAFPARKSRPLAAFRCDFLRILAERLRKR